MDEQKLKEKIRACKLKLRDMEQQLFDIKIEREKKILKRYQESLKNENYVKMKEKF